MKKFLGILAIAGVLVACDNAGDSEKRTKDSLDSVRVADSIRNATPVIVPTPDTTGTSTTTGGDTTGTSTTTGGDTTKR